MVDAVELPVREVCAIGLEAQRLTTRLLQRVRRRDPFAGVWEAADTQWWWQQPRPSDEIEHYFWADDEGPVAGFKLTSWSDNKPWQIDPMVVPGVGGVGLEDVWQRALTLATDHSPQGIDIPVRDGDQDLETIVQRDGFVPHEHDGTAWLAAVDRPVLRPTPRGFVIVDRSQRVGEEHPMRARNGDLVAQRVDECSLYDPQLDLRVETEGGQVAGYALFWFDHVTKVGLVEPVRTEDEFQRRGLADAMLREGIHRLIERGAERVKISRTNRRPLRLRTWQWASSPLRQPPGTAAYLR
ncbi:hypothetical protein AVL62_16120 [Serinicoccus chungangensis]|uniref:N-acetyltransferase domain-containing protein n=1 Tax=Serinicoccus chungangensis TaxID=767452 RepID=A0A0W8I915_9MICO|nr:hypothetical protein AVL62_16120 [Serinicoccus chungangensis]